MKCGTGSVTAITGWLERRGTASPKYSAMGPDHAPAQLSSAGARTSSALPERSKKPLPSCATSSTLWRSKICAPARCAASAKAGDTSRGLACPSSAHSEPPTARVPSQGQRSRRRAIRDQFESEVEVAAFRAVLLQRCHVGFAARDLEVARAQVLAVGADGFAQAAPDAMRTLRQWQLAHRTALAPHAAVVDAARARAAQVALQQHHADAHLPQGERGGCADDAAADDGDVRAQCLAIGHAPAPSVEGAGVAR